MCLSYGIQFDKSFRHQNCAIVDYIYEILCIIVIATARIESKIIPHLMKSNCVFCFSHNGSRTLCVIAPRHINTAATHTHTRIHMHLYFIYTRQAAHRAQPSTLSNRKLYRSQIEFFTCRVCVCSCASYPMCHLT